MLKDLKAQEGCCSTIESQMEKTAWVTRVSTLYKSFLWRKRSNVVCSKNYSQANVNSLRYASVDFRDVKKDDARAQESPELLTLLFWREQVGPMPRVEGWEEQTDLISGPGYSPLPSSKHWLRAGVKGLIVFLADPLRTLMGYLKSSLAKSPTAFRKGSF